MIKLQEEKQQKVISNKIETKFSRVTIAYSTIIYWRKRYPFLSTYFSGLKQSTLHVYSRKNNKPKAYLSNECI
jgi:hypothetical protein